MLPEASELISFRRSGAPLPVNQDTWSSMREYRDFHYRLLREEFVAPLRERMEQVGGRVVSRDCICVT